LIRILIGSLNGEGEDKTKYHWFSLGVALSVCCCLNLCYICSLTGIDYQNTWRIEGTSTFPLPPPFRRLCTDFEEICENSLKIPLPVCEDSDETESTSVSDVERNGNISKKIKNAKSQVPRTNTAPPLHPVPTTSLPLTTSDMELSAPPEDKSATVINMSEGGMEVMVEVEVDDKNSSPKIPTHNSLGNVSVVKSEVLVDEDKTYKIVEQETETFLKQEANEAVNSNQDLKIRDESNNLGISPFLVSLLQQPRNKCPPLDTRMSLLNIMTRFGNQCVHHEVTNGKEFGMAERHWLQLENSREQGVQTMPVSFAEEDDDCSSSEEDDNVPYTYRAIRRERSPDITDTPTSSPIKQRLSSLKNSANSRRARGAKRKLAVRRPTKLEIPPASKKTLKNTKQSKVKVKNTKQLPKIKIFSKRPPSTDEEDDVQMLSSEKSTAVPGPGRGRGLSKVRGGRGTGRGRGIGRGRPPINSNFQDQENSLTNPSTPLSASPSPLDPSSATIKMESPSPSRVPHFPSPSKPIHHTVGSTKPMKTAKPKKSKPVSCSRRKSSLKAKEDDEMQVTWDDHDYEGAVLVRGNNLIPIRKRRSVSSNDASVNSGDEHRRKERIYFDDSPEDQYWNRGIIKRRISTNTGDEDDPESLPYNDDETDSASENESERGDHLTPPAVPVHNNNSPVTPQRSKKSPSPSPPLQNPSANQKQRLTTPLKINSNSPGGCQVNQAQLPRITLPPPVFSTTLNDTRAPKPVSVVDSLNLHLPITPTASSLAASSAIRRTPTSAGASSSSSSGSTGTGCGIFSNSQALIANSRGTPGILQKQRKAQPHILSNSKAHQRTFIPTSNNNPSQSQSADSYPGEPDFLILTLPNNL